jgi:hypothetical protein
VRASGSAGLDDSRNDTGLTSVPGQPGFILGVIVRDAPRGEFLAEYTAHVVLTVRLRVLGEWDGYRTSSRFPVRPGHRFGWEGNEVRGAETCCEQFRPRDLGGPDESPRAAGHQVLQETRNLCDVGVGDGRAVRASDMTDPSHELWMSRFRNAAQAGGSA